MARDRRKNIDLYNKREVVDDHDAYVESKEAYSILKREIIASRVLLQTPKFAMFTVILASPKGCRISA